MTALVSLFSLSNRLWGLATDPPSPPSKRRRLNNAADNNAPRVPNQSPKKTQVTQRNNQRRRLPTSTTSADDSASAPGESEQPSPRSSTPAANGSLHRGSRPPKLNLAKDDKPNEPDERELRSKHGCSRVDTPLTKFFSDYEDVMFGGPGEPDLIDTKSTLTVTDKGPKGKVLPIRELPTANGYKTPPKNPNPNPKNNTVIVSRARDFDLRGAEPDPDETFNFEPYLSEIKDYSSDPLIPEYFKYHKVGQNAEKKDRSHSNKEAAKEEETLKEILAGLQGPMWPKALGITGIVDGQKKQWEPKRDIFISRVKTLLGKFDRWRTQEREVERRKREKERFASEEAVSAEYDDQSDQAESGEREVDLSDDSTSGSRKLAKATRQGKSKLQISAFVLDLPPPAPFVSFYAKPYLRDAALGKHRRGRSITAFGQPIPDISEQDFELPEEMVTEETIIASARRRRRLRRETVSNGA